MPNPPKRRGWRGRMPEGFVHRYPRRFILFGPRVVTVPEHITAMAKTQHDYQKTINRLMGTIQKYEVGMARRKRSLEKAHDYITDLKQRVA